MNQSMHFNPLIIFLLKFVFCFILLDVLFYASMRTQSKNRFFMISHFRANWFAVVACTYAQKLNVELVIGNEINLFKLLQLPLYFFYLNEHMFSHMF